MSEHLAVADRIPPRGEGYFANPYLACDHCGARVTHSLGVTNQPCGHHVGFESVCPSWGPVDGCQCVEHLGTRPHGDPQ
jgi:hypothetical protein